MSYHDPVGPAWTGPALSLRSRRSSGRVRVEAAGEMDLLTTPMVLAVIDAVVRIHEPSVVELDLTGLSLVSSCAVTALVEAANRMHAVGRRLEVTHAHGAVLRMLTITNTLDVLQSPGRDPAHRPAGDADVRSRPLTARTADAVNPLDRQRRWQVVDRQPRP